MLKALQILSLVVLTAIGLSLVPMFWIGIAPQDSLTSFLARGSVLSPLAAIIAIVTACWAFILGWDPTQAAVSRFRTNVVIPVFLSRRKMQAMLFFCTLGLVLIWAFFLSATSAPPPIFNLVLTDNFDVADKELAQLNSSSTKFADLNVITNALREQVKSTSQAGNKKDCRSYMGYLDNRQVFFQPMWLRYLFHSSKSACYHVLENPIAAIGELEQAKAIASWLPDNEVRRATRAIANILIRDKVGVTGIKDRKEQLRNIIKLIATDPDEAALRMLGNCYYELGEYAKAIEIWKQTLKNVTSTTERKRLINAIAMGYTAMEQHSNALDMLEQGLQLNYDSNSEVERTQQVRLLATAALVNAAIGNCSTAEKMWADREALKRQGRSPCTALLEAQVASCVPPQNIILDATRQKRLVNALLFGIGQDQNQSIDLTPAFTRALLDQAEITFSSCYLGLKFSRAAIESRITPTP